MTTLAATGNSQHYAEALPLPPSKSSSPTSPTAFQSQQASQARSIIGARSGTASGQSSPALASIGSLEAPPGMSYAEFIRTWTDTHVARWLADIKCANQANTFKTNDIRGDVLLELDQVTLKEMGVASIGDRLRILNAVKGLRQKTSNRASWYIPSTPKLLVSGGGGGAASFEFSNSTLSSSSANPGPSATPRMVTRRLDAGRPPPLHLSSDVKQSDLPRIVRDGLSPADSARLNQSGRTLPSPLQSAPLTPHVGNPERTPTAPFTRTNPANPARTQLPAIPARSGARSLIVGSQINGRRTPSQAEIPSYVNQPLPPAPTSSGGHLTPGNSSNSSWSPDARPGNTSVKPIRSMSPLLPAGGIRSNQPGARGGIVHGRNTSLSILEGQNSTSPPKVPARPSTSSSHPYASTQTSSLHPPSSNPGFILSPIAESFGGQSPSALHNPPYNVGRPVNRYNGIAGAPSLDDLRRKLIKFFLPDEGHSCMINVADCAGGIEVLEKALKKFGKGSSRSVDADGAMDPAHSEDGALLVDGWGVYVGQGETQGEALTEAELMAICHASPDHPVREGGLILRRNGKAKRNKGFTNVFNGSPPPPYRMSPTTASHDDRDGKRVSPGSAEQSFPDILTPKSTKRASSISVLSGLGVRDPEKALDPPLSPSLPSTLKAPEPVAVKRPSKLRNFFGQRPPSELITTHLTEYFPFTEKKVLERTARHSVMRSTGFAGLGGKRDSKRSSTMSWNPPLPSRFSTSTLGSQQRISTDKDRPSSRASRASTTSSASTSRSHSRATDTATPPYQSSEALPRVSLSTDDGTSLDISVDEQPQLLPPVQFPSESFSESVESLTTDLTTSRPIRTMSFSSMSISSRRSSYLTELRCKRDRSDTASLMTVDEITAEVESRRESMAIEQGEDSSDEWTNVGSLDGDIISSTETTLVDEEELLEEEDANIEEEEDLDEPEERATTGRANKWIKGALIGAGSFGKVYLGMDASSGLLMAVKQVELPTGGAINEDRKKNMLSALEREIELLKDLQHDNIVQYLYSSMEDEFLNIFLEYVPGGSVAALLNNYGAFEEPLVKNFVRQILQGLNYLHERDIIHRDIKGANILVDNKGGIKISDFGISKKVEDNLMGGSKRAHRPSLQGSVFWMAPEVVKQTSHTRKADIWSVGCLVVEMLTGEHPWAQLTQMQAMFKIGSLAAKPTIPTDISAEAQDFLTRTFEFDHEARPGAGELLQHPWIVPRVRTKASGAPKASALLEVTA